MPPRIALAGMILESNRFAKPAERQDFSEFVWEEGESLLVQARAETSAIAPEFSAFVKAMDATGPWQAVPCLLAASHPAGPVREAVFQEVADKIVQTLTASIASGPLDAVYLCNHGAMVAEHLHDPDGELVRLVRNAVGPKPLIIITLDLHGNISEGMVRDSDLIIAYRTNPHVDMIERGEEAAFSLRRCLASGQRPKMAMEKPPIAPASVSLLTASGPYADLIDYGQRRQAEMSGAILNVSIFGNFIFSDTPDNTLSIIVTARDDETAAQNLAREIAQQAWSQRERFQRVLTPVEDAVAIALAADRNPVIFSEAGDNPGGGGSGRTTALLRALHEAAAERVLYGSFYDPVLADDAHRHGIGEGFTARFNREQENIENPAPWEKWDRPFKVEAEVLALGDGTVIGKGGLLQGRRLKLGKTAALRIGGIVVVIISDRSQTADPVFFEMLGLDIAMAQTVVVKSRGHFRAGFRPWFSPEQVYEIDTAGLTSPVLSRWPFQHIPRPSFPLDPDTRWDSASSFA